MPIRVARLPPRAWPDLTPDPGNLRAWLDLTQAQMATALGVTVNTWARWERGESRPRGLHQRAALADLPRLARRQRPRPALLRSSRRKSQPSRRPGYSTGAALMKYAGTWVGDDLERCLELAHATRSEAEF